MQKKYIWINNSFYPLLKILVIQENLSKVKKFM